MALARFDWGQGKLSVASVGNITIRVLPASDGFSFRTRRGVIGLNAPKPLVTEHSWPGDPLFVLQSDGLETHWGQKDLPANASKRPVTVLAQDLLKALAKDYDDATLLVVRNMGN